MSRQGLRGLTCGLAGWLLLAGAVQSADKDEGFVPLFNGKDLTGWVIKGKPEGWQVKDGIIRSEGAKGGDWLRSEKEYGDFILKLDWKVSKDGNSGVFFAGKYELQILDSFRADTYTDGQTAAIYGQYPPILNACRPPGQWQTYDVAFRRPCFGSTGNLLVPANLTVFHNGILVQNNEEPFGPTSWLRWLPYKDEGDRGPIVLQDHAHPVRYRNIWIRKIRVP